MPIGFISDHMEVLYDLDIAAAAVCGEIGMHMVRAGTPGVHPRFIGMIRELIEKRVSGRPERPTVGALAPWPDTCPPDCCPPPQRPAPPASRGGTPKAAGSRPARPGVDPCRRARRPGRDA